MSTRQVRLDGDVVELVEARNPEGLSLSGRTNELLREVLTGPARDRDSDHALEPEVVTAAEEYFEPPVTTPVAPRRRRRERVTVGMVCPACGTRIRGSSCMTCGARR